MQLTKRQCWKVIRTLVVKKNNEYKEFLKVTLGGSASKEIQGYTRKMFLDKFNIKTLNDFYERAKKRNGGEKPNNEWLENLSSEDLILFLDFRCRVLQEIYDFYRKNKRINKNEIKEIVQSTKLSLLAIYNGAELMCGGKPKRVDGELKNSELPYSLDELNEMALTQVLDGMGDQYMLNFQASVEQANYVKRIIRTSNIDINEQLTGYKLLITTTKKDENKPKKQAVNYNDGRFHFVGYDENMNQIYILNGEQVNFYGEPIPHANIVFDTNKKPIYDEEEFKKSKFIGLDIQGTPIYSDGYGNCFTSTGEVVDDELFIDNTQDDAWEL